MLLTILRWILVLPSAVIGPVVVVMLLKLLIAFIGVTGDITGGLGPTIFFENEQGVLYLIFEYGFTAALFVIIGTYTAPDYRKVVSVILGSFIYAYFVLQVVLVVLHHENLVSTFPIVYGIAASIGASIAIWSVFEKPDAELVDWVNG